MSGDHLAAALADYCGRAVRLRPFGEVEVNVAERERKGARSLLIGQFFKGNFIGGLVEKETSLRVSTGAKTV